jgi:hypothetical protein
LVAISARHYPHGGHAVNRDRAFWWLVVVVCVGVASAVGAAVWLVVAGLRDQLPVAAIVVGVVGTLTAFVGRLGLRTVVQCEMEEARARLRRMEDT